MIGHELHRERRFVCRRQAAGVVRKAAANIGLGLNFDLTPDGKRIIAVMPAPSETQNHVTLILNFFDDVQRRLAGHGK
jgi:hypothetical protein